jgi:hypothetical protein
MTVSNRLKRFKQFKPQSAKNTIETVLKEKWGSSSGSYRRGTSLTKMRVTLWITTVIHLDTPTKDPFGVFGVLYGVK